jgi:hypothetical protein
MSDEVTFQLDTGIRFRVSPEDARLVIGQTWTVDYDGYVKNVGSRENPLRQKRLHVCIFGQEMDHHDGDILNNRRDNLRPATKSQQAANRKRAITNKSGFKGVIARRGRWQARLKKDGRCYYSPLFDTAEEAHRWYADKAKELHGEFARTC